KALEDVALDLRVPFRGFWLDAPKGVLESRIQMRTNDASDADVSILAQQRDRDVGAITWTLVDANDDASNIARTVQSKITR
ncbi:MAG: aminoglycoside phosphotransferase, partial [Pseudomonadota bacterium]